MRVKVSHSLIACSCGPCITCLHEQFISNTCEYFTMYFILSGCFIAMIAINLILFELNSVSYFCRLIMYIEDTFYAC